MEPIIQSPSELAQARFTSKVRKQRNIDLVAGLKASNSDIAAALNYLKKGTSLADSTGVLLDAWGEQFDIKREGRDDIDYRSTLIKESGSQSVSVTSRPSVGSFMHQTYNLIWLTLDKVGLTTGAVGAAFNRVPLRTIFVQCGGMAPDINLPESLVSATFAGDIYSAATPPNTKLTQHAPMFPGNAFPCVWGGFHYEKTQKTIMATTGKGLRIAGSKSLLTRISGTQTQPGTGLVEPFNTLVTVKPIKVNNG